MCSSDLLNIPALANSQIDLANSQTIQFTCSQPNYGYTANVRYHVQVALTPDMNNFVELSEASHGAKINVDAAELASTLTNMAVSAGKTDADFPMSIPVYFRVRANVENYSGVPMEGTDILSNVVSLNNVYLVYSLPPVKTPERLYLVGSFCNWNWDNYVEMVPVNGAANVFWHLVFIDDSGIKFNTARAWDGGDVGFGGINVGGDLAGDIIDAGGNIASSNPGWYLMIVTASVSEMPTGVSSILLPCLRFRQQQTANLFHLHLRLIVPAATATVCVLTSRFRDMTGGRLSSWYSTSGLSTVPTAVTRSVLREP